MKKRTLSVDEVVAMIAEQLRQEDGEMIEDIFNRVLAPKIKYKGDSLFTQEVGG